MSKRSINQKHITILNVYSPNGRDPKYIKQKLVDLQGEINPQL